MELKEIEEELSSTNLNRLLNSLRVFRESEEELTDKQLIHIGLNTVILSEIVHALNRGYVTVEKEKIPLLFHIKREIHSLIGNKTFPLNQSNLLKLRDSLNKYLSRYTLKYPESLNEEASVKEIPEGMSKKELYEYFIQKEIDKLKKSYRKKELQDIEQIAKRDLESYIYSEGNYKPVPPKDFDTEIYKAVKELLNSDRMKVRHIIQKKEDLSEVEKKKKLSLDEVLDKVSEIVLERERKKK